MASPWHVLPIGLLGSLVLLAGCARDEAEQPVPDAGDAPAAQTSARPPESEVPGPHGKYAGAASCAICHEAEAAAWQGSHHDLAMELPTPDSVLGDFADSRYEGPVERARFFRRDDGFYIETTGPDGEPAEYRVAYTFGADPLQQYLIEFPDGRLQAFALAWDTRPREAGGQRWFHVYGDAPPVRGERIHWTGLDQTWNYMCADCHSTGFRKGYDAAADRYASTYTDIDVACEACHGPGAAHAAWAQSGAEGTDPGFPVDLGQSDRRRMSVEGSPNVRFEGTVNRQEVETCGRCHARRTSLREPYAHGKPLADSFMPALLTEPLYQPDGQILDEVYVYGSFRQSRMYEAGVTCSDCHEPHSLTLKGEGDAVCAQCHEPAHFSAFDHTGHAPGPEAPGCRDCHMPARNYMVVDARRDHSFRVPRPDLAAALGVTDACAACHVDRPDGWSAAVLRERLGRDAQGLQNFAVAFRRAAEGWPDAVPDLLALIDDDGQPALVRATALTHLAGFPSRSAFPRIAAEVYDGDPLVRLGAVYAAEGYPENVRAPMLMPLLADPVLAVRAEAARLLADVDPASLPAESREALRSALADYVAMQRLNADRPESRLNLGNLYADAGDAVTAESQYRAALALQPDFAPAWSNLADLQRARGDEAAAEVTLREGLEAGAEPAALEHALGLLMVRDGRREEALEWLGRAANSAPDNPRLGYVYGVALHDLGQPDAAIRSLEQVHERRPADVEVLAALVAYTREAGQAGAAAEYAKRLAAIAPGHPAAREPGGADRP